MFFLHNYLDNYLEISNISFYLYMYIYTFVSKDEVSILQMYFQCLYSAHYTHISAF